MRFAFKIAARFLKSAKAQTFLIILGIAIGVSVQVFIGTLIQGLQKSLIDKTVGSSSHITVTSSESNKAISDWQPKIDAIKKSDSNIKYVSPSIDLSGFIKFKDKTEPILIRGFELKDADKIYKLKKNLVSGTQNLKDNEIYIGSDLKNELNVKNGDSVTVATPSGNTQKLIVKGFYDLKVASINKSWVITTMATADKIFDYGKNITTIEIQIKDVFKADKITQKIIKKLDSRNNSLKVDNWQKANASLLSGLNGQSASSYMIQVFVIISVILGIVSVLAITVIQKSKQIGILKAMGIRDSVASLVFLFEGLILGLLGAIVGVGLGVGLTYSFTKFALNPDKTPIVPLYLDTRFILLSGIIAVLAASLASIIPAIKSSKLSPIEVIKNG